MCHIRIIGSYSEEGCHIEFIFVVHSSSLQVNIIHYTDSANILYYIPV